MRLRRSWVTVGQVLAAWGVLAVLLGSGFALAGALTAHRLLLRRKMDSLHMHRYIQVAPLFPFRAPAPSMRLPEAPGWWCGMAAPPT